MVVLQDVVVDTAELDDTFAAFCRAYPAFASTRKLDELRTTEYGRLDALGHVYLDYTGGGLYSESQVRQHMDLLLSNVFGNPHSENPTSLAMTELVEQTRAAVLRFFNASPAEYDVIFTPNATGALKLVGEAYPFGRGDHYLLTFDNHNSVNGIREFAKAKGAHVSYIAVEPPDLRVSRDRLAAGFHHPATGGHRFYGLLADGLGRRRAGGNNLFAFPAQSNFSGVQHPLEWIAEAQALGWDVLLDAAAFAPTNRLDLGRWHPDFVALSFYKIFGYPTGLGSLIARKDALAKLRRPWYAGGTISISSVQAADVPSGGFFRAPGPAGFEDGTVNYLSIPAIEIGLRHIAAIGIETIHTRVMCLTAWLLDTLTALRHSNGTPLLRIYGPTDARMRGGTIALNVFDADNRLIDCRLVERTANQRSLSLRSGCHCNPGVAEVGFGLDKAMLAAIYTEAKQMSFDDFVQITDGKTTGAARVSAGLVTTFGDVYRFVQFARQYRDVSLSAVAAGIA